MTALEFYQKALLRLLTTLFVTAGIVPGGKPVERLPRLVRNEILRVLLPLESAVRRLIFFRMKRMAAPESETVSQRDRKKTNRKQRKSTGERKGGTRAPVFWLFDKLKWFAELSDPRRRPPKGPGPNMSFFDERDAPREPVADKSARDPDDAARLCRRLQAVMRALGDIDAQALRLKRIIAARKAHPKPKQTVPMRPGYAPGYRRERTHDVDELLSACNGMANERVPPDGERPAFHTDDQASGFAQRLARIPDSINTPGAL